MIIDLLSTVLLTSSLICRGLRKGKSICHFVMVCNTYRIFRSEAQVIYDEMLEDEEEEEEVSDRLAKLTTTND